MSFDEALGATHRTMGVVGEIDGEWPPPLVSVSITQSTTEDAFFILRDPFTYLSVGPSNASPLSIGEGELIEADYEILVRDHGPLSPPSG